MSNNIENEILNKNKQYIGIGIITAIILLLVIIYLVSSKGSNKNPSTASNNSTVPQISVVQEDGKYDATIDAKIPSVRNIKLGMKKSKVIKMERKMADTGEGSDNVSQDGSGISFLTYSFVSDAETAPTFFEGQVILSDSHANLTYEFRDDKLSEIRINFGALGDSYDSIVEKNTKIYGEPNLVRAYSNGNTSTYWRTKECMLTLYKQENMDGGYDVLAYYSDVD